MYATRGSPDTYIPGGLLLQWHVTERCNLRCSHCYQDGTTGEELGCDDLLGILEQYVNLLGRWRRNAHPVPVVGHITVTGGEPFVRSDFLRLLDRLALLSPCFSFAVLTNGTFIDAAMARRLRSVGPAFVQVSLEGTRTTHDAIRGAASFDRTVSAVKQLVRVGVRTVISFTAHRANYREFGEVARLGRRLRVDRVWADRLIPSGSGAALAGQVLAPEETRDFLRLMQRAQAQRSWFGRTQIAMHRALQFLVAGGRPYHCSAGDTLLTLQPNGDLYPCRRMPIRVGNVLETPLEELYYGSDLFRALRDRGRIGDGCDGCFYARSCRGGLSCLSYALTGDPFSADPGCWRARTTKPIHTSNLQAEPPRAPAAPAGVCG